jgi:hypothetical protein
MSMGRNVAPFLNPEPGLGKLFALPNDKKDHQNAKRKCPKPKKEPLNAAADGKNGIFEALRIPSNLARGGLFIECGPSRNSLFFSGAGRGA